MTIIASERRPLAAAIAAAQLSSVTEIRWSEAAQALDLVAPAAVIVEVPADRAATFNSLAEQIAARQPYIPLIVVDPTVPLPANAIPLSSIDAPPDRLTARLRAALRVRALHATMLRRLAAQPSAAHPDPDSDPLQDATVLLIGRGASYPALSVALGEQLGVVGALSIEAAAKHLNARDVDGIVIGDGFSPRVLDAFLTVLAEDTRFRNLPIVAPVGPTGAYDLPNLEFVAGDPAHVVASALPLIRQHAFEQRIIRTLRSIDAGGLLDPRTGLLTPAAFSRDFTAAVEQTLARNAGLSVARFSFGESHPREQCDAARILSRLMRRMDFGTLHQDGSITAVFVDAGARNAAAIAKRLASVMKHTAYSARHGSRIDPQIAVESLLPTDSAATLLARLQSDARRAAS
jgi:hypothetical protein